MHDQSTNHKIDELVKALHKSRTPNETTDLLKDLLSPHELDNIAKRWEVAMLLRDKHSYHEIRRRTGLSSATIAKVSTALQHGSGMLRKIIERL